MNILEDMNRKLDRLLQLFGDEQQEILPGVTVLEKAPVQAVEDVTTDMLPLLQKMPYSRGGVMTELTPEQKQTIYRMYDADNDTPYDLIAKEAHCSKTTVRNYIRKRNVAGSIAPKQPRKRHTNSWYATLYIQVEEYLRTHKYASYHEIAKVVGVDGKTLDRKYGDYYKPWGDYYKSQQKRK